MASAPISYGSDYGAEQANIERQRQYAQLLQQQSMQQPEQQMAGGWVVPQSWTQGLAKAVQGVAGAYKTKNADEREKALADKYRTDMANTIKQGTAAESGTPAQPANNDVMQSNQSLDSFDGNPAQAAQPKNLKLAAQIWLASPDPAMRQRGMMLLDQARKQDQFAQMTGMGGQPPQAAGAPMPQGGAGMPPQGAPQGGGMPMGAPQGQAPGFDRNGVPIADVQRIGAQDDPMAAYQKHVEELFKPKMSANGQVVQYQRLPNGSWGYGPGAGAVDTARQFAGVLSPVQQQEMALKDAEYFDKTRRHLPGWTGGGAPATGGGMPQQPASPLDSLPPDAAEAIRRDMANDPNVQAGKSVNIAMDPSRPMSRMPVAPIRGNVPTGITPPSGGIPQSGGAGMSPAGERATSADMAKQLNELAAKELFEGSKTSQKAVEQLSALNESRKAIRAGAFQGSGADAKTDVVKFANGVLGLNIDPAKATQSDYLRSTLGSQVLAQAKALGTNPSNTDAKRIEEIVGNLNKDPGAMDQLLDWQESMIRKAVGNHNSNVDQTEKRGYKPPYDLRVQLPPPMVFDAPATPQRRAADKNPPKVIDFNALPKGR